MPVLLLVGPGHAHLYVVKRAAELAAVGYRVLLLAPRFFTYSGVASASATGALARDTGRIDVRALAGGCGVEFREGTLTSLDHEARIAVASDGSQLSYDVLSINIGSVVDPTDMHVHPAVLKVKPLSGLADLDIRLKRAGHPRAKVTVVGAGASGLELAAHLATRSDVAHVQLVEAGPDIGAGLPSGARKRIGRLLTTRGVTVLTGYAVRDLGEHQLVCGDGSELSHDLALLATGLMAPPVLSEIGIGDDDGVPVRATLQHLKYDEIYAVGDCANFVSHPLPRIGVHGVRQGPILQANLLARLSGGQLLAYEPPRRALSILDLGGGVALAVRGRWWWYGAGSLRLKRYIDRRWLTTYQ